MVVAKERNLIIVGDSAFAEVAFEYFSHDSHYNVSAFAVEQDYLKRTELLDRPVVPFETMIHRYPPETHDVYVAVVYTQLNQLRTRLAEAAKRAGYGLASYISPKAFVWRNVTIGEHCFIFENNVIQAFAEVGNNVVLWSGNHIGHHSHIANNVFISSHVVISGCCEIGANCFLGVNVAVGNNITVAKDCWVGPGVVISSSTREGQIFRSPAPEIAKVGARRFFKVKE